MNIGSSSLLLAVTIAGLPARAEGSPTEVGLEGGDNS